MDSLQLTTQLKLVTLPLGKLVDRSLSFPWINNSSWPLASHSASSFATKISERAALCHIKVTLLLFLIPLLLNLSLVRKETICDPHGPGSSVHEILQARILEWVAIPFPNSQGILPDPGIHPGLLHCRQILYCQSCLWNLDMIYLAIQHRKLTDGQDPNSKWYSFLRKRI